MIFFNCTRLILICSHLYKLYFSCEAWLRFTILILGLTLKATPPDSVSILTIQVARYPSSTVIL